MKEQYFNMTVSIIIPIYKVEPYIVRCIESVLHQTYRNLEVIFVDDCTPDRSMELAKECIEQSPLSKDLSFVYLKHDHNRGLSAARNTGMDAAAGEYIYFLDSDDEITEDCIESLTEPLHSKLYDFVIGDFDVVDGYMQFPPMMEGGKELLTNKEIVDTYGQRKWYGTAWNKLCNLSFLKSNGLYFKEGIVHEDVLWGFELACLASSMRIVNLHVYKYRIREGSIMQMGNVNRSAKDMLTIVHEAYLFQRKNNLFNYNVDLLIRNMHTNVEFWMRRRPKFSIRRYYLSARNADCRTFREKMLIYKNMIHIIRQFDFFLPCSLGFIYRSTIWNTIKYFSGNHNIPFVY